MSSISLAPPNAPAPDAPSTVAPAVTSRVVLWQLAALAGVLAWAYFPMLRTFADKCQHMRPGRGQSPVAGRLDGLVMNLSVAALQGLQYLIVEAANPTHRKHSRQYPLLVSAGIRSPDRVPVPLLGSAHRDRTATVGEPQLDAGRERGHDLAEHVDDVGVEQRAAPLDDRLDAVRGRAGRGVHALGGDRVVDVGDGGDPGHLVDLAARLAVGIAAAVAALVVAQHDRLDQRAPLTAAEQVDPHPRMGLHDLPLLRGEPRHGPQHHLRRIPIRSR